MKIIGVGPDGGVTFQDVLDHGIDPAGLAHDRGFIAIRPIDVVRDDHGELVLRLQVRPPTGEHRPTIQPRGRDAGLVLTPDRPPVVRQRVAGYAVVLSARGLLATEFSNRTAIAGRWGMPGGGLDDHEQPEAAVLREVMEETSQIIRLGKLIKVHTSRWIGRNPDREVEDFHAVRLIYRAHCEAPTDPFVLDSDGTTRSARWVPVDSWETLHWTQNWHEVLAELLGPGG
jgi:8-oxo-dGTP pyrophosphatase MutT (NUDIX family)